MEMEEFPFSEKINSNSNGNDQQHNDIKKPDESEVSPVVESLSVESYLLL